MPTKLNIKDLVKDYKSDIEKQLSLLLNELEKSKLTESIKYSVLDGGKRLRAILALITAEAINNSKSKIELCKNPSLGLALAVELVHCGSLIHDDLPCMDNDDLRRGKPSNHKAFDEATALLAGDFLLCYPIEVLLSKTQDVDSFKLHQVSVEFSKAIRSMILGQEMDLELSDKETHDIDLLKKMQALKTGALLKASIRLSAIIADASKDQIEALSFFADNLGLAFQIMDDILDVTLSTKELGKTAGKDTEQNKFTFVKEYGVDRARVIAEKLILDAKSKILDIDIYPDKLLTVADYVVLRNN
jgi:geranylgeranyl diphosphate synthase, type II